RPRTRGPVRPGRRGGGHGEGAAGRHRLHPGRHRARDAVRDPPAPREEARGGGRDPRRPAARGGGRVGATMSEERHIQIDAEALAGKRFPYQEDISLVEDVDLNAATPGADINWLEDVELLGEEGVPAAFVRDSHWIWSP